MAAIDFPASPAVGQTFTPASGVTYVWNGTLWLVSSGSTPGGDFHAVNTVSGVAAPTTATTFIFNSVTTGNSGSWYNTASGRYTPPPGRFKISTSVTFIYASAATWGSLYLRKNGVTIAQENFTAVNPYSQPVIDIVVDANGTDWFDVQISMAAVGINTTSLNWFNAVPIGGAQGPPGPPGLTGTGDFYAINASAFSLTGTYATVALNTVSSGNSGGWYNTTTGRYTPPAGRYMLSAALWGLSSTGGAALDLKFRKNGTDLPGNPSTTGGAANTWVEPSLQYMVDANGSDWFDVQARSLITNATTVQGYFTAIPLTGAVGPQGPAGQMVNIGVTPPSASPGVLWWNSELGQLFLRYDDGNTSQWVPAATPQSQPVQQGWRSLGSVNFTTPQATIDFQNIPSDINYLMLMGQMRPVTNGVMCYLRVYDGAGALVTAAGYHTYGTVQAGLTVAAPAQYTNMNGGSFVLNSVSNMISNNIAPGGGVGFDVKFFAIRNTGNFRRRMTIASNWLNSTDTDVFSYYASGEYGNVSTPVTGLQLMFHTGAIAAAQVELWGAP